MTGLPSGVTSMLRTMSPPPGIAQLWNFSLAGSKRTMVFGLAPDSLYQSRALGEDDAIGLGLRPARRRPFLHVAGLEIETAEHAAREIGVPDGVVIGEGEAARTRAVVRQFVFLDRHALRIDAGDLRRAEFDDIRHAL